MKRPEPIKPKPGQESVWDYPRPPKLEQFKGHVRIVFNGQTIADSNATFRVLETSHPPVFYIPQEDIRMGYFIPDTKQMSFCEFKGRAKYFHIEVHDKVASHAAWCYPDPKGNFKIIKDYLAFYPSRMDACYVNDELVQSQEGDFYGGWITSNIVGPFKGGNGTWGW